MKAARILIVEDDAILVTRLEQTLIQSGYRVTGVAATGEAAVESALAQKPDVILMDIRLRGEMTGIQAAVEIHRQMDAPIIYLTAYTDEEMLQQAKVTDAYAFLAKPVRDRELRASLEMALYKHATEQRIHHLNQILRAVRGVNQLITREHDAQRLLDQACEILLHSHGYHFVWIGKSAGDRLKPIAHAGNGQNLIKHIVATATSEQGMRLPGTEAARTRQVVICHNMPQDERYAPWREEVEQAHFLSTAAVPILHEESLFGVLSVYSDQINIFGAEEIDLLLEMAGDIAFGLKAIDREAERQRAEKELLKFKLGIERSVDAIFMTDPQGVIFYTNPAFEQIYGYNQSDVLGQTPRILKSGVVQTNQYQQFWATLLNKGVVAGEIFNKTKDGRIINIEGSNNPILDTEGNIIGFLGIHRDISERKRAEQELEESAERLQEAQRIAKIGNWTMNLVNNEMVWSDEIYRIFEIAQAESGASRETFFKVIHPDDRDTVSKFFKSFLETRNAYEFEHRLLMPDGRVKYVHERGETFYDVKQQPIRSVGTVEDITERQKAEQAIRESEERFSTIFHASPIPILIIRAADGKFVDVNEAFQNLSGYKREEVIGHSVPELNHWSNPDELRRLEILVREQGAAHNFDARLRAKSGQIHDVLMSAAPIEVSGERYIVNMAYDITARKQHEIELQAIARLSAALRTANSRVEMLPVIVEQLVTLLNCETVSIEITDPLTGDAVIEAAHGNWAALIGTRQKSGTGINAIISQTRQPYSTNDLKNDPNLAYPEWTHSGILGSIGAPLVAHDHLIGFLWAGRKSEMVQSDIRLLVSVADMAANAIYRVTLYERSQKDAADLVLAYDSTLEGWAHALELRDQETEGHTRRVMQMTVDLAKAMCVDERELENVRRGAMLHDIGKMGIPDSILLKPGTLNEREWEIMRLHPEYAYKFLESIEYLHPVIDIPYCHHEKWDGSGYPRGLAGEQIPFTARIFAIVDVWDALRSDRPYRKAWSDETIRKYIVQQSGKHFDPQVVQVFLAHI
jgi:PAS domain S-box-containing protein